MSVNHFDLTYFQLAKTVLEQGVEKSDRTGTGTKSIFGYQMRFDLSEGFPLLTTKRVPFHLIVSELLWFLRGDTNIRYLLEHNNHIWDEWAFMRYILSDEYKGPDMTDFGRRSQLDPLFKEQYDQEHQQFCTRILEDDAFAQKFGELGNIYGAQWRRWKTTQGEVIDQLAQVIDTLKTNPDSRRMIVSAWNPEDVPMMALPPCHTLYQFYVLDGKLSCQLYQRSGDIFLGVPFNIASYALLTHLIAKEVGLEVGEFIHTLGDAHIYLNHMEQIQTQLSRTPKEAPKLVITPGKSLRDYTVHDIQVTGYDPYPPIKAPVAV